MLRVVSLLFVISLSPVIARADTVSGIFVFRGSFGSLTQVLQFGGGGLSVNAVASTQFGINLPAMFTCIQCTSGTTVSMSSSAFLVGGDFVFGTVTVNGVPRPLSTLTSSMSFAAGTVTIPVTTDPFITLTAPFTLTSGSIAGFSFIGSGTASLVLRFVGTDAAGNSQYRFEELGYRFTAETIPEPASMLLLLTGLLALPARFCKRKPPA